MMTPKVPLFRNSEQDDETRRQSREYVLVQIEKYSALDVDTLGEHIPIIYTTEKTIFR